MILFKAARHPQPVTGGIGAPPLARKATSIKHSTVPPLYTSSSILGSVPSLSRKGTSVLNNAEVSELKRKTSDVEDDDSEPELKKQKSSLSEEEEVIELVRKGTSVLSHRSIPELKKQATSVRSIAGVSVSIPSVISLSEARVLLSRQETTTRIIGVTGGSPEKQSSSASSKTGGTLLKKSSTVSRKIGRSLQKKGSSVSSKTGGSLQKKSSSVSRKLSKPASIIRKSSSVKSASLPSLPKRKHIPKKIFEPSDSITPKKQKQKQRKVKSKSDDKPNERALLYLRGEFLALRTDNGKKFCTKKRMILPLLSSCC